jgi:hypothetical protein
MNELQERQNESLLSSREQMSSKMVIKEFTYRQLARAVDKLSWFLDQELGWEWFSVFIFNV